MKNLVVILDNVRSAHNVGSIFRTADGAGVEKLYLVGITPAPTDRFGREQAEIKKTSLGATQNIPWEKVGQGDTTAVDEAVGLIDRLKADGYTVVAVEQAPNTVTLKDFNAPQKLALIFGAEVDGVSAKLLEHADVIVEIPMLGKKESLNVSVAAGIVLFAAT